VGRAERPEHPLKIAKELGLLSLHASSGCPQTMSYDGLEDLAVAQYWKRRARLASRVA